MTANALTPSPYVLVAELDENASAEAVRLNIERCPGFLGTGWRRGRWRGP
jgi:hypothetical protein